MKLILKLSLLIVFLFLNQTKAQFPSYTLVAKNFVKLSPNSLTFEIYLTHTDTARFEYSGSQLFFNFNTSVANGGTLQYTIAPGFFPSDSSDLPVNMRPRFPQIFSNQLRLSTNSLPGAGSGIVFPQGQQYKLIKMKLETSASSFAEVSLALQWRNAPSANPVTKVLVYLNSLNTEITTPATHTIDSTFIVPAFVTCNIKLALEGLLNSANDQMVKRESVTAYLRDTLSPYSVLDSSIAFVDSVTLTGEFDFENSSTGNYYIVVKHRNSLETWSKSGGEFLIAGINNYDFTSSPSHAFGNNLVLKGNKYCIFSGNVNGDNIIDITDMLFVDNDAYNYVSGEPVTNLNGDNIVDIEDLALVDYNARNLVSVKSPLMILRKKFSTRYAYELSNFSK